MVTVKMNRLVTIVFACSTLLLMSFSWRTDFEKAKADAASSHKLILLKFSGSDWCIPCISMEKNVFSSTDFQHFADSNLVMVNADFPRQKKHQPDKAVSTMNENLAATYNKDGHFPLTLLLTPEGRIVRRWDGYSGTKPEEFLEQLKSVAK